MTTFVKYIYIYQHKNASTDRKVSAKIAYFQIVILIFFFFCLHLFHNFIWSYIFLKYIKNFFQTGSFSSSRLDFLFEAVIPWTWRKKLLGFYLFQLPISEPTLWFLSLFVYVGVLPRKEGLNIHNQCLASVLLALVTWLMHLSCFWTTHFSLDDFQRAPDSSCPACLTLFASISQK